VRFSKYDFRRQGIPGWVAENYREIVEDIKSLIPHRYPFLMLDRVVEIKEGESVKAYKNVSINEDYFRGVSADVAKGFEEQGSRQFAKTYAEGASRVQFQDKDPRGWREFADRLGEHDVTGAANT